MSDLADKRTGRGNEIIPSKYLREQINVLTGVDTDLVSQDDEFKQKILDIETKLNDLIALVNQKNTEYDAKWDIVENPEEPFVSFTAQMTDTNQMEVDITSDYETTHIITLIGDDGT